VIAQSSANVYNINKEYRIVNLNGNKCALFFKNKKNNLRAVMEGCDKILTNISVDADNPLTDKEKSYLLVFIRAKKYILTKEAADMLDIAIIKYDDGREEYLSEKLLLKRINRGISFAKVYAGKLKLLQLTIPAESKRCSYNFMKAKVNKLIIEENCEINVDFRDNDTIESLIVKDKFVGSLSLSRCNVESVFIGNNCRCNLTITDSKKCLNLQIADICSGNINISNSCLYMLSLGYYSYADIMLSNNVIKKEIVVGDAFRGGLYSINQSVELFKIGKDCRGWLKFNAQNTDLGIKQIEVGEEFAGNINLSGDNSIKTINVADRNTGKIIASYSSALERVNLGKYFNGGLDLSGSSIKEIYVEDGASGNINVQGCKILRILQATIDNNLYIDGEIKTVDVLSQIGKTNYYFEDIKPKWRHVPFYKRIYNSFVKYN